MSKRILFLGAAPQQCPPIRYANSQGYHTITVDNNPSNKGHYISRESHNISTVDIEGVLKLAKKLNIDGVVAYASDPAALTAACVSNEMGLTGNPVESVRILSNKSLWRKFLSENNFNVPNFTTYNLKQCYDFEDVKLRYPLYVKPVDSSGSKGVTRVKNSSELKESIKHAAKFTRSDQIIMEEEISISGKQIAGDGFVIGGKLSAACFADENFNYKLNGLVPIGQTFPTGLSQSKQNIIKDNTQKILNLLKIESGALNFDIVFDKNNKLYFIELGPRNGGCRIPEVIKYHSSLDMIKITVEQSIGNLKNKQIEQNEKGYWASFIIHSLKKGNFKNIEVNTKFKKNIFDIELYKKKGDKVEVFDGSNNTIGTCILKFNSKNEMNEHFKEPEKNIKVILE
jgi:biotin carboxylase